MTESRRAAFVDRDGTIIVDAHYISRPEQVRLVPGAADALRRLNEAGVPVVVVTNQSGIARGTITESEYARVAERVELLVREAGASIDATYYCPHHPAITGPCDCRKPGTGMFEQAADEMELDLRGSLYVGDKWRDVAPGIALGGRAILVASAETPADDLARAERDAEVAGSLGDAVIAFLSESAR
ncbi:MAG: HAD family hydrolase [Gemmatimonadaceae bacterium]|nr:HAD family hydrolase [Gemmatimonadaceae bacterium]NUQ91816.1 HAD family hydrolase [Gemmatimonadaceae bacterium]NUS98268.1 HAD family hydrolase [Gemmatimonadaceae bacterium]